MSDANDKIESRLARVEGRVDELEHTLTTLYSQTSRLASDARRDIDSVIMQIGVDFHDFRRIMTSQVDRLVSVFAEANRRLERVEEAIAGDRELRDERQHRVDDDRAELNRRLAAIEARQQWRIDKIGRAHV